MCIRDSPIYRWIGRSPQRNGRALRIHPPHPTHRNKTRRKPGAEAAVTFGQDDDVTVLTLTRDPVPTRVQETRAIPCLLYTSCSNSSWLSSSPVVIRPERNLSSGRMSRGSLLPVSCFSSFTEFLICVRLEPTLIRHQTSYPQPYPTTNSHNFWRLR